MRTIQLVLLILIVGLMLPSIAGSTLIIIPPPRPPPPPSPPPTVKRVVVVDDDGSDCPNADVVGEDALKRALSLLVDNGTIIACTGSYDELSNLVYAQWTRRYKPVVIKANGSVVARLTDAGDIVVYGLKLVVVDNAGLRGGYARLYNTSMVLTNTNPLRGPGIAVLNLLSDKVVIEGSNITYRNTFRPIVSGRSSSIVLNNVYIDAGLYVTANTVIIANSTKTSIGDQSFGGIIGDPTWGLWIELAEPSMRITGGYVVLENSTVYGTVFVSGNVIVLRRNLFDIRFGFNRPPAPPALLNGFDGIVLNASNLTVEYNVFRNHRSPKGLWGMLRVVSGGGVIRRNLFYGNDVGLIVDFYAYPLVYDNLFIDNRVHAASTMGTSIASIDPPRDGPNVIGGPLLGGNYWDDYYGPDVDGDGLGDVPYVNSYNIVDIHPLVPWSTYRCPPYMGGITVPANETFLIHPYIPLLSATGLLGVVVYRRRRGLSGLIGLGVSIMVGVLLVLLVGQIAYTTSTSALAKTASPLTPIGEPVIDNGILHLTLYNPGPARVCIEYGVVNGTVTLLYPVVVYDNNILPPLVEDILSKGYVNASILLEQRFIEPKHARKFKAYVHVGRGVVELDVVANNGVWKMYTDSR